MFGTLNWDNIPYLSSAHIKMLNEAYAERYGYIATDGGRNYVGFRGNLETMNSCHAEYLYKDTTVNGTRCSAYYGNGEHTEGVNIDELKDLVYHEHTLSSRESFNRLMLLHKKYNCYAKYLTKPIKAYNHTTDLSYLTRIVLTGREWNNTPNNSYDREWSGVYTLGTDQYYGMFGTTVASRTLYIYEGTPSYGNSLTSATLYLRGIMALKGTLKVKINTVQSATYNYYPYYTASANIDDHIELFSKNFDTFEEIDETIPIEFPGTWYRTSSTSQTANLNLRPYIYSIPDFKYKE